MDSLKQVSHRLRLYEKVDKELKQVLQLCISLNEALTHKLPSQAAESYDILEHSKLLVKREKNVLHDAKHIFNDEIMCEELRGVLAHMRSLIHQHKKDMYISEEVAGHLTVLVEKLLSMDSRLAKREQYAAADLKLVRKILSAPPDEVAKEYLFRGVSHHELKLIKNGHAIESAVDNKNSLEGHVVRRVDEVNRFSRFISLTSKRDVAEHFGRLIIVKRRLLEGDLLAPEMLCKKLGSEAGKYIRKNNEFILTPTRGRARIPASAVMWIAA